MLVSLDQTSSVPLYQQIVEQISSHILAGHMRAGDQLPSVRQLATELLTSLITTRRAYQDLETAGMIETRAGRGTFVAIMDEATRDRFRTADVEEHLVRAVRAANRVQMSRARILTLLERISNEEGLEE